MKRVHKHIISQILKNNDFVDDLLRPVVGLHLITYVIPHIRRKLKLKENAPLNVS